MSRGSETCRVFASVPRVLSGLPCARWCEIGMLIGTCGAVIVAQSTSAMPGRTGGSVMQAVLNTTLALFLVMAAQWSLASPDLLRSRRSLSDALSETLVRCTHGGQPTVSHELCSSLDPRSVSVVGDARPRSATSSLARATGARGDEGFTGHRHARPDFLAQDPRTSLYVSSDQLRGQMTLLAFVSPTCTACELVADELAAFGRATRANLILPCRGARDGCQTFVDERFPNVQAILTEPLPKRSKCKAPRRP